MEILYSGLCETVIGASHVESGKICQDASAFKIHEKYAIAVVADGHGSKRHFRSDIGSKIAVNVVLNTVSEFFKNFEEFKLNFKEYPQKIIKKIQKHIITNWNKEIFIYHENNPVDTNERKALTDEEYEKLKVESIYGSTLIVAVMSEDFCFGLQIGDGSLVVLNANAKAEMPIIDDESCPANLTASLCNTKAIDMFNFVYRFNKPLAMFVSTDGLYTSFNSEDDFKDYHNIIASQLHDVETLQPSIKNNLTKRTSYGSKDDISLSIIFDEEMLNAKMDYIKEQILVNKNRAGIREAEQRAKLLKQKAKMASMQEE